MKSADIQKAVLMGARLLVGEYRMGKAESINYRNKADGKSLTAIVSRHTVECGSDAITVSEFNPDGLVRPEDFKVPFARGTQVVVHLIELTIDKGNISCRGKLEKLD